MYVHPWIWFLRRKLHQHWNISRAAFCVKPWRNRVTRDANGSIHHPIKKFLKLELKIVTLSKENTTKDLNQPRETQTFKTLKFIVSKNILLEKKIVWTREKEVWSLYLNKYKVNLLIIK